MKIPNFYRKRLNHWIDKRAPRSTQHKLTQRNLYTFPNRTGLGLLITLIIIWLMGTNYQNNLVLAIAYLLISLFIVAIWQAYRNLSGIEINAINSQPGFAGDDIRFSLHITTPNPQGCEHIEISWPEGKKIILDLDGNSPMDIDIPCPSHHRGYLFPGRLLIESRYPLGVIRCWTYIQLDMMALVFPKPIAAKEPEHTEAKDESEKSSHKKGGDDPGTLRNYQPGDSLKHIAWKLYARERGLHTKQHEQTLSHHKWLDWFSVALPQEQRLSVLCYWALAYEKAGIEYGLLLPEKTLSPNTGHQHLQQVLSELAVYGLQKPATEKNERKKL